MSSGKGRVKTPKTRQKHLKRIPTEWTFQTGAVAAAFDSHVREQLPWYEMATGIVRHAVRCYLPERGTVVDVGASTGNIGRAIAETLKARHASLYAIESSQEMADRYIGPGRLIVADARAWEFETGLQIDVIVCFLALMFIPVPDRLKLIRRMKDALRPGGALIVFDKTMPKPGYLGTVAYRLTLAAKHEQDASPKEIIEKELSISGLQRPMSSSELTGFDEIFRFGDFAGFIWERHPD